MQIVQDNIPPFDNGIHQPKRLCRWIRNSNLFVYVPRENSVLRSPWLVMPRIELSEGTLELLTYTGGSFSYNL